MTESNYPIELLETGKIIAVLEPENKPFLAKLEIFDSLDSTNTYLLAEAKKGTPSGTVCFAEQQTHGRGRRGRAWFSPHGANIYCSMLWDFVTTENISGLSIAVAIMIANCLRKYGIVAGIQLKWPNDVLFEGRKLAGILLERSGNRIIIGVGMNLYLSSEADSAWTCVHEITGQPVTRNYLAGLLVNELITQLRWYQTRGLDKFLQIFRQYDSLYNRNITLLLPEKTVVGVMQGINDQGELLLRDAEEKLQTFCYGEVSVRS